MLQNIPKEKILEIVKQGPTIPSKIVKIVGGDTMLIGAILSTMISTGEVKYSTLKVGGSPVYYVPEQEAKLEEFIQYLNDKDQKVARALKEQKIMLDSRQDSLTKFSLKTIKDFAKAFEVNNNGKNELFYRYFLISKEDAESLAKEMLKEHAIIREAEKEAAAEKEEVVTASEAAEEPVEEPVKATKHHKPEETHHEKKIVSPDEEKHEKTKEKTREEKKDFFEAIKEYVHNAGLDIISKEKIKKTEYSLVLKNHDSNEYIYCIAKDKKAINEGDLSTAFVFSHQKKMPCIFLMTGKLTKKAESMSQKEFKDMKIEQL